MSVRSRCERSFSLFRNDGRQPFCPSPYSHHPAQYGPAAKAVAIAAAPAPFAQCPQGRPSFQSGHAPVRSGRSKTWWIKPSLSFSAPSANGRRENGSAAIPRSRYYRTADAWATQASICSSTNVSPWRSFNVFLSGGPSNMPAGSSNPDALNIVKLTASFDVEMTAAYLPFFKKWGFLYCIRSCASGMACGPLRADGSTAPFAKALANFQ